jgi:hypothetical protein
MTLFVYFACALILAPAIIISRNGDVIQVLPMLASSLGFALLLTVLVNLLSKVTRTAAVTVGTSLLLGMLLVRFMLGFLYDFSGRGFSSEFFAHISFISLKIGLQEYDNQAWVMLIVFTTLTYFAARLISRQSETNAKINISLLPVAALLIYSGATAAPEIQLAHAYTRYNQPQLTDQGLPISIVREQSGLLLQNLRPDQPLPLDKSQLRAGLPPAPLNLIFVYLESFNEIFTQSTLYPGLTPRIDALKKRYFSFDQIHSSGYVTIEGIANSQCGTLMNMEYANSSMVTSRGRLPELPCLGDILKAAGYQQAYLGGAELIFAGKGAFLRDHGYDDIRGWEYWKDMGYERFNDWGLSDTVLFDQAFELIQEKHAQSTPFNVTMLTLGTHTPGFVYEDCPVYSSDTDKPFVNAIHCSDYLLGNFIDKLEQNDILNDTVLLVQADHGSFIPHEILRQFGNSVSDTRLLTLLSVPESVKARFPDFRENAEGTNLDMVSSLLDLLGVSTNTSFIFSRSHFQPPIESRYFLSRRQDYSDFQRFENDRYRCDDPDRTAPPRMPLDNCDKNRVMQAVSELNLTYALNADATNRVCELGVRIEIESDTGKVSLIWGNQNLSDQFYRRGAKRNKHKTKGVYAVLLDAQDTVIKALFFEPEEELDMRDIHELYMKAQSGERILLIRNVDMQSLAPNIAAMWPDQLRDQTVVYGVFKDQRLVPTFESATLPLSTPLKPSSCKP